MERKQYSNEQRATVMAALLTGQSISQVAREYKMPRGTVSRWAGELDRPKNHDEPQKKEIGDLLLGYVAESIKTLTAQVKAVGDAEWVKKQPASEIAVLHGVIADKTIRLLEALAPVSAEPAVA